MRFHVAGTIVYRVRISPEPLTLHGQRCMGVCDEAQREITLSCDLPARHRLHVLAHELAHAWDYAAGEPKDGEAWCDRMGAVLSAALRDLAMCGGEDALMRLRPGESPGPAACRLVLSRERRCAICSGSVAGASVVAHPSEVPGVAELALWCEWCGHVQHWRETVTQHGYPSGQVEGEPTFERGEAAGKWLAEHRQAVGVVNI